MKTHKLLIPVLVFGLLVLSCSKSSTPMVGTSQAQTAFSNVNSSLANDLGDLSSSPGGVAMTAFSGLTGSPGNPIGRIRSFNKPAEITAAMTASLATFRQMILKGSANERVQSTDPFDYSTKVGVYTWSKANKSFSKTGESSFIEIDFPTDSTSNVNNAALTITNFKDVSTPKGYQPTLVQASLTVDGTEEVTLKLTAGYDSEGNTNKATVDLFINPFTLTFGFDNSQATSFTENYSLSKSGTLLIGTGVTVQFANEASKQSFSPSSATAYVQLLNVRFTTVVDGSKAATAQTPNDYIFTTVTVDGGIAGHVVWVDASQTGDYQPYMQYNDTTVAPVALKTIFTDLATQLSAYKIG